MDTDIPTLREAATVTPRALGTLDAIHLVTGMAVKDEIEAFVTYDSRLAAAARAAGLQVIAPS
jgi:predicted nucleic acid-binding protein